MHFLSAALATPAHGLLALLTALAVGMAIGVGPGAASAVACGVQSIAQAMRTCGACVAAPPVRNWYRADRMDNDRCRPTNEVVVRYDGLPAIDSLGRHAHVRGIYLAARGVFNLAAGNVPVSAYNLRALWRAIFLQDSTGWQYLAALSDGRDILDDNFFRHGWARVHNPLLQSGVQDLPTPTITQDAGIPQDAGAGQPVVGFSSDVSLYFPLVTLGRGGNPIAGLIPLATLQRAASGGIRFRVGASSDLPGNDGTVTFTGLTRLNGDPGMDVWLDIVYLPAILVPEAWQLDQYTQPEQNLVLHNPDRKTNLAVIRYKPEDAPALAGQALVSAMDGITLQLAGYTVMGGLTTSDFFTRQTLFAGSERDGAWTRDNAAQDLPLFNAQGPTAGVLLPFSFPRAAPAGDVVVQYAQRTPTFTRYLHRTTACHTKARVERIIRDCKCDPCACAVMGVDDRGNVGGAKPTSTSPMVVVQKLRASLG